MSDDAAFSTDGDGASIAIAESALAISSREASLSSSSPGEPCDSRIFGIGGISGSSCGGDGDGFSLGKKPSVFSVAALPSLSEVFRVSLWVTSVLYCLVTLGGFIDVPELVVGRPPLVWGLTRIVVCMGEESDPE